MSTLKSSSLWPLPQWVVRLVGFSSLAAALVSLAVYWLKKYPPRGNRRVNGSPYPELRHHHSGSNGSSPLRRSHSSLADLQSLPSSQPIKAPKHTGWGARILGGVIATTSSIRKSRKRMTLSLKNTILWNPSQDVDIPNHAFHENAVVLLTRLAQLYDIYVIVHITSESERGQINGLLKNAGLLDTKSGLDARKILYCSTEEGKIHMIRHIEPHIHVEGGWELDDGEDIVRKLRPYIAKLVWVITRRRRSSFNRAQLKESDQGILGANVELTEKLLDTSIAKQVGFVVEE